MAEGDITQPTTNTNADEDRVDQISESDAMVVRYSEEELRVRRQRARLGGQMDGEGTEGKGME